MTQFALAGQLLSALRREWGLMLAVLPGLALTMLHSTALDLPRAELVDALDSDHYRIQWILGSYLLGSAVGMALTGFIGGRLGLRFAYLFALLLFALSAGACALVSEIIWMTPLRLLQGLGNGLLISSAMVLIWRAFPVQKELAMALYGMAVYLPALAGAPVGGLLITWLSWRLIFLINLPLGLLIALIAWHNLPEDRPASPVAQPFDWFGLALLIALVVPLNVVVDLGQYWGWWASPFFAPWIASLLIAFIAFTVWGVWAARPLINLRPLGLRHFALGLGIKVLFSINLYVLVGLLSGYMVNLRGYQWWQGSLVLVPGLAAMFLSVLIATALGNDANRKLRLFLGLALMAAGTWRLSALDIYTARAWQAGCLVMWGIGAGLVCGPALLTTFEGLSTEQTLRTAGVFNLMRSLPTFLIAGLLGSLWTQRTDANFDWLRQDVRLTRPIIKQALHGSGSHFVNRGSNRGEATKQAHALLGKWVHRNARAFALQDLFQLLALAPALGMFLVLGIRIPASEANAKGTGLEPAPFGSEPLKVN